MRFSLSFGYDSRIVHGLILAVNVTSKLLRLRAARRKVVIV
jgi:hypothetical protein